MIGKCDMCGTFNNVKLLEDINLSLDLSVCDDCIRWADEYIGMSPQTNKEN